MIFEGRGSFLPGEVLYSGPDPLLDLVLSRRPIASKRIWRLEHYPGAVPAARVATRVRTIPDWSTLANEAASVTDPGVVFFRSADLPAESGGPAARSARVTRWDGFSGEVEHDGTCDLVLRRACYPGWTAWLDGVREVRIVPADGGLQAVRLPGSGVTKVEMRFRPTYLWPAASVSLAAIAAAFGSLVASSVRGKQASRGSIGRVDVSGANKGDIRRE